MQLTAVIHKCAAPETGYWAEVPSLPGCVTEGETLAEVQKMIREAVSLWLDSQNTIAERQNSGRLESVCV